MFRQINRTLYEHRYNSKDKKLNTANATKILDKQECLKMKIFI